MYRRWNQFKLYLRERLRITSRIDFSYEGKFMVKRRKYEDVIISKNFENKLELKSRRELERIRKEPNIEKLSLQELEKYREDKIQREIEDQKDDTSQKILLEGIE